MDGSVGVGSGGARRECGGVGGWVKRIGARGDLGMVVSFFFVIVVRDRAGVKWK